MPVQPSKPKRLEGHYFGMIFGEPGAGKTTLAGKAPDPTFIDTGNETLVLAYNKNLNQNVTVYNVSSHQEIMEVVNDVRIGKIKCQTLVLDNVTDQNRLQLQHSADKLKTGRNFADTIIPIQQDFGIAYAAIGDMLDKMKEQSFPCDVLLIAHKREVQDKAGNLVAIRAGLNPQLAGRMLGAVDFCLYMTRKTNSVKKEVERTLQANPYKMVEAKNRIALPDEFPAEDLWSMIESRRG